MLSTRACQLASTTFDDTPTVPLLVLVAGLDQHADECSRPLGTTQDADLVVVEPDLGDLGIELPDRLP